MAKGIIGDPFTFTALFVDSSGDPITPLNPSIEVFYFDAVGDKQGVVVAGTAMTAVAGDTGRYKYTVTIPAILTPAIMLYGVMEGEDPATGVSAVVEEGVDCFESGGGGVDVESEGVALGTFTTINFVGVDVEVLDVGGVATVYIPPLPPPSYDSHWNTNDGDNGNQSVSESISRSTTRISTPHGGEGVPFSTGGWAGSNHSTSLQSSATFTTSSTTTGFGGDASAEINVYDADGVTVLDTYTTPVLDANATHTSASGFIVVTISSYGIDDPIYPARQKAKMSVAAAVENVLTAAALDGGRYNVEVIMTPDSATDGSGPYTYTQTAVFLDTNPTTPSISGTVTLAETPGSTVTRYLSGLEYYDIGSEFTITVTGIDQLNRNTSRTSQNLRITASDFGLPTLNVSPFGTGAANFGGWTNDENVDGVTYTQTNWAINSGSYRETTATGTASAFPRDTWANGGTVLSTTDSIVIDTHTQTSTDVADYFDDESYRQDSGYNGGTAPGNWNSNNALVAGEAMVYGGQLLAPNEADQSNWTTFNPGGPDYSAMGAPVAYYRTMVDPSPATNRASLTFNFAGTFLSDAATDLANENLKVYIRRRASSNGGNTGPAAPPLLLHGGLYNFATFDDGVTDGHIREASSSGNTINATFGGFTCETGFFVEVEIVNAGIKLNSMITTLI
jgi:hypothetical protein